MALHIFSFVLFVIVSLFSLLLFCLILRVIEPSLLGTGGTGYPYVPSPEFPSTNGTGVTGAPAVVTPTVVPENWKQNSGGPQSLMKEPPLVANRNGPASFSTQGQSQAAVMMVYGLDNTTSNTDKLFNLVCLYGNVARIKFLKTKEGTAMVQMGEPVAVERCVQHLNNIPIGNNGKLQIA